MGTPEYFTLARILHVLAVVVWIGGVAMVTTVILPAVRKLKSKEEQIATFEQLERRFSRQAKFSTLLAAVTGFYMLDVLDAWEKLTDLRYWYLHAMIALWMIFTFILFVAEPFFLHKLFARYASRNPDKTFTFIYRAHWVLFILSLITIVGAVAGSHGLHFF